MKRLKIKIGNTLWYPLVTLSALAQLISVTMLVWAWVSSVEIAMKNLSGNPVYSTWNLWLKVLGS